LYPKRSDILENIAITALKLNDIDSARMYFNRAINLNWAQGRSIIELAQLAYNESDYQTASEYYDKFIQLVDRDIYLQDAKTLLLGAKIAKSNNQRLQAANYGLQLRDLFPNSAEYKYYSTGFTYE